MSNAPVDMRAESLLDRRVNRDEVMERYAYSNGALYLAIKAGSFPQPHRKAGGRSTYWWESDLLEYEKVCKQNLNY